MVASPSSYLSGFEKTVAAPLTTIIASIHSSFSYKLVVHIIHEVSSDLITFQQNPSLKLPISSRPPPNPLEFLKIGLMS